MTTEPPDSNLTPKLDHQISQAAIAIAADSEFTSQATLSLRGPAGLIPERPLELMIECQRGSA